MQLTSSRSSGKWPGLASRTGSRGAGEPATPCPRLVLGRCAPHAGPRPAAPRAPGTRREPRARGQVQGCRRVGLRIVRAQRAGLRPPRSRAALARRQERAQWGLGRSARRGGGASGIGTPPAPGRGGGGASECFPCCPTAAALGLLLNFHSHGRLYAGWQGFPAGAETCVYP